MTAKNEKEKEVGILDLAKIPFLKSPPMHFVYRSTATLQFGQYVFDRTNTPKSNFNPRINIEQNRLYLIRSFSFSADINILDYQAAFFGTGQVNVPTFSLYLKANEAAPFLRQPLQLPTYYEEQDFPKVFIPQRIAGPAAQSGSAALVTAKSLNEFQGFFKGVLDQIPALIGKQSVTLILTLNGTEVQDDGFISRYRKSLRGAK